MPLLNAVSNVAGGPEEASPTMTSPAAIRSLLMTASRRMRATTVLSTTTVLTRSPRSAVSPPVDTMLTPFARSDARHCSVPAMSSESTSPEIRFLLRPMVEDRRMLSVAPTHARSSTFMITASCAIPRQTERSPVVFQYRYASEDLVPAPSACITMQYSGSPLKWSGTILQNARGKRPLLSCAIAECTSSFPDDTPLCMYRSLDEDRSVDDSILNRVKTQRVRRWATQ
mmetsp:Transcript_1133/g.3216  ORF Transcript_1133/g.3216 Transcript_1133/m.3216 type:complete len:228 (-) Transcript_1133:257-940(-)